MRKTMNQEHKTPKETSESLKDKNNSGTIEAEKNMEVEEPEAIETVAVSEVEPPETEAQENEPVAPSPEAWWAEKSALEEKIKNYEEQNLRIRAEFTNYKRRLEREQSEFAEYIKGDILSKLLPVLDDFKMMFKKSLAGANEQSILEGARLIYENFNQILEKEGLERMRVLGEKFNPQLHEALMMRPIDNEEEHEKVIEVFQDGFKFKDRLLRPSKVIVGKYENNQF